MDDNALLQRAGEACRELAPADILTVISYMLWIAHYRRQPAAAAGGLGACPHGKVHDASAGNARMRKHDAPDRSPSVSRLRSAQVTPS